MNCKNVNNNNNNVSKLDTSSTYSDTGTGKIFKPTNKGKESTDYTFDLKIKLPKGLLCREIFVETFIFIFLSKEVVHFLKVIFLKTQSEASAK